MSLVNGEGLSAADIAAVTGNNNGFGDFGANGWWIIILLLFAFGGGWGNGYGNGGNGAVPYIDSTVQRGFDQSAVMGGLGGVQNAITSGFVDVQLGLAGVNQNIAQMGYNMSTQFLNGFCDNKLGIANLGADIAREACADRQAINEGLMNLTAQNNANTNMLVNTINSGIQSLKDMNFQQQLDAERRENQNLRTQLNMQNLAASQAQQTAQLVADNNAQTQYLVNRIAPTAVPAYTVPNPNVGGCCGNYGTCGFSA